MERLIVSGGKPLEGTVHVSGSKNAALPLIFATILTENACTIENLPAIRDVEMSLEILAAMGASIRYLDRATVEIDTGALKPILPPPHLVAALRASTYLMGAMLGRFGRAYVQDFGGCNFSPRPIDMHLYAAEALGAWRQGDTLFASQGLTGAILSFDKVSVGATVNALLMAASAKGTTVIENAACEPHVENLIAFLRSMGARILRIGASLVVEGCALKGGRTSVIGDMIEGGTYLLAGLATGGRVTVTGCESAHLDAFLSLLAGSGARACIRDGRITLSGSLSSPLLIKTAPYPAFPTDLQPQTAAVCALHTGGIVTEGVFPHRFGYLSALGAMGLSFVKNGCTAYIFPSRLTPAAVRAADLRGGAALLLATLAAKGESVIEGASCILRGYEDVVEKFSSLGADIQLIKDTK